MATNFSISSDSESDPSEEVEERDSSQSPHPQDHQNPVRQRHMLTLPDLKMSGGRLRLNSESHPPRDEEGRGEDEADTPTDGFRRRTKSAPPELWAAKKYGRQLRRMSDEFDSLLDRGEMKKLRSDGPAKPMHHSRSWWSYLFSHQETEGENNHHENHTHRTE
ncbi:BCL2 associated agonist of cell death b isoform X2 [Antennarius striatus]|uniref:BCL2 associated agonist of cell death b isoform X2 n=1 Tax=Antennarius striatus TaxID=241820 RepID=UPI0035B4F683